MNFGARKFTGRAAAFPAMIVSFAALALSAGAGSALAQGCDVKYPVMNDAYFQQILDVLGLLKEDQMSERVREYLDKHKLDEDQMMAAMFRLYLNVQNAFAEGTKNVIEEKYPDCWEQLAYSGAEQAAFEKYLPDFLKATLDPGTN